ncbi:hypothetical protein [Clostridium botulinum]
MDNHCKYMCHSDYFTNNFFMSQGNILMMEKARIKQFQQQMMIEICMI